MEEKNSLLGLLISDKQSVSHDADWENDMRTTIRSDLIKDYNKYKSVSELARQYDVSRDIMRDYLNKYEVKYKTKARKYECDHGFFSRNGEEQFYWAGFLAGNGNISTNTGGRISYRIFINMSFRDEDYLTMFKEAIQSEAPVKKLTINKKTNPYLTVRFLVSSKEMVNDLDERFNVVPRKTYIYTMPKWVEDHNLVRHFMRGWVDAKSNFFLDKTTNKLTYFKTSGTVPFLKSFMAVLEKYCGIEEKNIKIRRSKNNQELGYIVYTGKNDLRKIADFLYTDANVYLKRKRDAAVSVL